MVNFTVSLPEDLKAEMEKYPDVNWSEFTRKSIQSYLVSRKNPFPSLEFEMTGLNVSYDSDLMKPVMSLLLSANNNSDIEIVLDRMLFKVEFDKEHGRAKLMGAFNGQFLEYQSVRGQEIINFKISFYPKIDMLKRLSEKLESTFWVYATLTVFAQGFGAPLTKVVNTKVPIDEWKKQVTSTLNNYDADWKSSN